jgi:hypothetical protein
METLKKYWFLFLLVPVVGYVIYLWMKENKEVNNSTAKAREAKATYAAIRKLDETETQNYNGRDITENQNSIAKD